MTIIRYFKMVFPYIFIGNSFTSFVNGDYSNGVVFGLATILMFTLFKKENDDLMKLSYEDEVKV